MSYRTDSLHQRLLAGDESALREVRRWVAESLAAARFWPLRAEWNDLQQEILCSIVESLRSGRFRDGGEFKRYVWGICRHTALNRLARSSRHPVIHGHLQPEGIPSAMDPELTMMSAQLVRRALDESSPHCRELIRVFFLEGMTHAEMAARFGIPVGTVKSRLFRCLQCLRRSLAPDAHHGSRLQKVSE